VRFANAEGIEPGKTEVRCLGLKVGMAEKIDPAPDLQSTVLELRIDADKMNLLRGGSQIWVVRPRVSKSGITGLSTLISGAYVEWQPGKSTTPVNHFEGLEQPPGAITSTTPKP
jgi:paraquat-inducible protein B